MQKGLEVLAIVLEPAQIRAARDGEAFTPQLTAQMQQAARDGVDRFLGSRADVPIVRPATLALARQLLAAVLEETAAANKLAVFAQNGPTLTDFAVVAPPAVEAAPALVP